MEARELAALRQRVATGWVPVTLEDGREIRAIEIRERRTEGRDDPATVTVVLVTTTDGGG